MHDIQDKLSVRNMPDLTIKAIIINKIKSPARKQIEKYKRYGKEFKNDLAGIYILEDIVLSIKMDCRTDDDYRILHSALTSHIWFFAFIR